MTDDPISYTPETIVSILHSMRDGMDGSGEGTSVEMMRGGRNVTHHGDADMDPVGSLVAALDARAVVCREVLEALSILTPMQREIIVRVHILGEYHEAVARTYHCSRWWIGVLRIRALRTMSDWLGH